MQASAAAYLGYERAKSPSPQGAGTRRPARSMKRRQLWRPAIEALKVSLALKEGRGASAPPMTRSSPRRASASSTTRPTPMPRSRACACSFRSGSQRARSTSPSSSASTARRRRASSPKAGNSASTAWRTAGATRSRYAPGLPSAVDETLLKSTDLTVYVRDRAPSVRATGRAYVLPRTGQQGLPLVSVNADALAIEVYRVGDRGLAQQLQDGEFQRRSQQRRHRPDQGAHRRQGLQRRTRRSRASSTRT